MDVLDKVKELVDFYVAWIQGADDQSEANEAMLELMEMEGLFVQELSRPGRIIMQSSFYSGSKVAADTRPKKALVEARRKVVEKGLIRAKKIYEDKGWEF